MEPTTTVRESIELARAAIGQTLHTTTHDTPMCSFGHYGRTSATIQVAYRRRRLDNAEGPWVVSDPMCDEHRATYGPCLGEAIGSTRGIVFDTIDLPL